MKKILLLTLFIYIGLTGCSGSTAAVQPSPETTALPAVKQVVGAATPLKTAAKQPIIENTPGLRIDPTVIGIGVATTFISDAVNIGDTVINIMESTAFPKSGVVVIDDEIISYKNKKGLSLIGCSAATRNHNLGALIYCDSEFDGRYDIEVSYPVSIHNGINEYTQELKKITTSAGETTADIPIKRPFYGQVTDVILHSDNPADQLRAESYVAETNSIRISGFAPSTSRTAAIRYKYISTFKLVPRLPDRPIHGFARPPDYVLDWISIADSTPLMVPFETKYIDITLKIPPNIKNINELPKYELPQKWEFMIYVYDNSGGTVQVEVAFTFLIGMR